MEKIIPIQGKVKFTITLDPGVWIFDDRRVDLTTYFDTNHDEADELEEYKKNISKHWDREIMEGAIFPPTLKTEKKFEKERVLTGTFGMPLKPFLKNAEIDQDALVLSLVTSEGAVEMPLEVGKELILAFSKDGKPLKEDGPVHGYYGDGSNRSQPITNILSIAIK